MYILMGVWWLVQDARDGEYIEAAGHNVYFWGNLDALACPQNYVWTFLLAGGSTVPLVGTFIWEQEPRAQRFAEVSALLEDDRMTSTVKLNWNSTKA